MRDYNQFDWLYFIANINVNPDMSCRVSALHKEVFHGQGNYPMSSTSEEEFKPVPAASNDYREPLHITRSGRFVPPIFMAGRSLVVNETIFNELKKISGIVAEQVVFEKLVDLPMPALGDMSYYDRDLRYKEDPHPRHEYEYLEDNQHFQESIGAYYSILSGIPRDLDDKEYEWKTVNPTFSKYLRPSRYGTQKICHKVIEQFPVYRSGFLFVRQDVFQIIAPYLNLDYFAIDVIDYDKL